MAQQTGRQYDDDLTVGADEYNESFSTDYVDLFEPLGEDDAPIAKLKTIVLSIDWEITDDILHQLHEELQDLKDVWAGNKINLVYIQALEKIGRYIYAEKAHSHPNAIKLLLAFYYNLEKIVSSVSMSEEDKKQLLLQDIKKFDQFKLQIAPPAIKEKNKDTTDGPVATLTRVIAHPVDNPTSPSQGKKNVLTNLKAIVLGIDWEISDNELVRLSEEVSNLEKVFSENRAKLIFLQGIGALGNYIRSTKSNAHPDAFKLLHSFFQGLEKTYNEVLSGVQEKEILLAEVKKFNALKAVIATVTSEVVVPVDDSVSATGEGEIEEEDESEGEGGVIAPAFADMPEDVHGYREDAEAVKQEIDKSVESFLGEEKTVADQSAAVVAKTISTEPEGPEVSSRLDALFGNIDEEPASAGGEVSADIALSGVEVETEADDDSDEKALPLAGGALAPALAETSGQSVYAEEISSEKAPFKPSVADGSIIPGVDVETEADDDSEEAALPREQGEVAPALAFTDESFGFRETEFVADPDEEEFDLEDRLHSFFGAEIEEASLGSAFLTDNVDEETLLVETSPEEDDLFNDEEIKTDSIAEELGISAIAEPPVEIEETTESLVADVVAEEPVISIPEPSVAIEETEPPVADIFVEEQGVSIKEPPVEIEETTSLFADVIAEEQDILVPEPLVVVEETEAPPVADVVFEEESAGLSGEERSESLEVVFEPVGDDVAVDDLPVVSGADVIDDEMPLEQEVLTGLRECVDLILLKKYEVAFPVFFVEINRLRQEWQANYTKNSFLQLLLTVGQYIDKYQMVADAETLALLQSLYEKLEQISLGKSDFDEGPKRLLFNETSTVLLWQQRLIAALMERHEGEDVSSENGDDVTDLFSEK